jgi:hypothetical protein
MMKELVLYIGSVVVGVVKAFVVLPVAIHAQ